MSDDTEVLDELVVVGYGELRRREITGSVTNVTAESFNQGNLRRGRLAPRKVAGLRITTPSGDVTDGTVYD